MDKKLFKILLFMKRRPGMSQDEFIRYYEEKHVPLALKYSQGMTAYKRQFVNPQAHFETGECPDLGFDVITELSFDDERTRNQVLKYLATSPLADEVVEDEKKLFDHSSFRIATVTEFETALSQSD
jgi:uncharacterized protein (TIGR02118 family)